MRERHDGFTAVKRKRFIKVLTKTGCITDAARVAGVSRKTADYWRAKDPDFARVCETALHQASSHLETLAWERAVVGVEEPIYHYGKFVGMRVKRSDAIFRMLLMASNSKKYGRLGAVRKQVEAELRIKIEAELRAKLLPRVATDEEVSEALMKALTAYRGRLLAEQGEEADGATAERRGGRVRRSS